MKNRTRQFMTTIKLSTALLLILLSLVISTSGVAQEAPAVSDDANSINEQTIYIPYDKLREVFERDGRGVFLPYD